MFLQDKLSSFYQHEVVCKRIDIFEGVKVDTYMQQLLKVGVRSLAIMVFAFCAMTLPSIAQVSSSGYSLVVTTGYETVYPDTTHRDNIYIFCHESGNLSASLADVPGELTFEWFQYDSLQNTFVSYSGPETGSSSSVNGLGNGGYRARITNGDGLDTLFMAWIFINNPSASANVVRHDCQVIDLLGEVVAEDFIYFNPLTSGRYVLTDEPAFSWEADPFVPVASRPDPRVWNPPPVETSYTLTALYLSCTAKNTIIEDPVATRAGFEFEPGEGEAPLEVMFDAGKSLNASEYQWYFDYRTGDLDTEPPDDTTPDPQYTYYIPGEYDITLRTVNGLCDDVFTHPEPVRVFPSELEVPNVFSPDGDGDSDVFQVRAVSMRDFRGIIYNRNGRKVFEWSDPSESWDGTAAGGGIASPGTYFYVITGLGWDDREYEFTGPLYIYRGR